MLHDVQLNSLDLYQYMTLGGLIARVLDHGLFLGLGIFHYIYFDTPSGCTTYHCEYTRSMQVEAVAVTVLEFLGIPLDILNFWVIM